MQMACVWISFKWVVLMGLMARLGEYISCGQLLLYCFCIFHQLLWNVFISRCISHIWMCQLRRMKRCLDKKMQALFQVTVYYEELSQAAMWQWVALINHIRCVGVSNVECLRYCLGFSFSLQSSMEMKWIASFLAEWKSILSNST